MTCISLQTLLNFLIFTVVWVVNGILAVFGVGALYYALRKRCPSPTMSTHVPPSAPPPTSTYVPASEPPSVSAYIPTSALPYVIPYTTTQEPSAQATLISPEDAAMYETATAIATMRPL